MADAPDVRILLPSSPSLVLTSTWFSGFWTLDPIDGTKGFLRGEQYAVCLALIVDARVELGVIGCPHLPVSASAPTGERGCVFVAVRGQGAYQLPLSPHSTAEPIRLTIPDLAQDQLNLLESVEKAHAKLSFNDKVAEVLGITREPTRMDSQAKYCALARGDGGVYLRMPVGSGYREKIWVRMLTDLRGKTCVADRCRWYIGPRTRLCPRRRGWRRHHGLPWPTT